MQPQRQGDRYVALIRSFCAAVKIDNLASVLETGSVLVDSVPFSFHPHATEHADYLVLYCDFGLPPLDLAARALPRLLEINLFLSGTVPPSSFVVNPDNGHVLLSYRCDLAQIDAPKLIECIHACVEQAKRFRKTAFLEEPATDTAAAATKGRGLFDAIVAGSAPRRVAI